MPALASWLLLVLYLVVGLANIIRGLLAFRVASVLAPVGTSISPSLVGVIYLTWAAGLLGIGISCFRVRSVRARHAVVGSALLYQATVWLIRLVGDQSTYARSLWPRDLVLTLLFLALVWGLTALARLRRAQADDRSGHRESEVRQTDGS